MVLAAAGQVVERLLAVAHLDELVDHPAGSEVFADQEPMAVVILHEHDRDRLRRRHLAHPPRVAPPWCVDKVKENVLPWPLAEVTHPRPPWDRTIFLTYASPIPSPCTSTAWSRVNMLKIRS